MNEKLKETADTYYQLAEERAAHYFESLYKQVIEKDYVSRLTKDLQSWKPNHVRRFSFLFFLSRKERKQAPDQYSHYIKWLDYTGKLDDYLDRSITYLFMRDLGKDLDSAETQDKIRKVVDSLRGYLIKSNHTNRKDDTFSLRALYRMAQNENVESAVIWVMKKLKTVSFNIPKGMDAIHAQRKLIKIIAGVIMHVLEEMDDDLPQTERTKKLDEAIRLGYSYGLTYPFIDDLLDADSLSEKEKKQYSDIIRTTLVTGSVPEIGVWSGKNRGLITYVHSELREAYAYIKKHQRPETIKSFFEQSYVFFNSQEVDRVKNLSNEQYTNEELFIPIILKSSSSRLIVRSVIGSSQDEEVNSRTFFYGIYNQLADDFADLFEDLENDAVTPYTYYLKYHNKRQDLINPFELYWAVISTLIHDVYRSHAKAKEVILNRAINGLKRFKERVGTRKYDEVMGIFASENSKFYQVIQGLVRKADDVDFFDKLLRSHIILTLKKNQKEQKEFLETIKTGRTRINNLLNIQKKDLSIMAEPIVDAANYSLEGDGKRIRPIISWVTGVQLYSLKESAIFPLLRSLEYMHTASLIFDDLPSQDNSSIRRGKQTLHEMYNTAMAELTGLFLTQKAYEEQASLDQFDSQTVLRLIKYSAQTTADMCRGQAIDLDSKGKKLTLDQLNTMCFYKTGIGFEASLLMPAILAKADDVEMEALKLFARHAGIAFQIKDDLLDVEGDLNLLGKPARKDIENNNSTFVTILGQETAEKEMWNHYCLALESLQNVPRNITFLKHLMNYIVYRDY